MEIESTHGGGTGAARRAEAAVVLDDVVSFLDQDTEQGLLERLVDVARATTGARFGAALLVGPDGAPSALAHQGMTTSQVAVLPHLPRPVGLIGVVLTGRTLRLDDMREHPDGVGLPSRHTPMAALLGVPMTAGGQVVGAVYLTLPPGHGTFTATDEAAVAALARQAAACATSLRESHRAHELLDLLALAPAEDQEGVAAGEDRIVRRLLTAARHSADLDAAVLTRVQDGVQTVVAVDAAGAGLPVPAVLEGARLPLDQGFCSRVLDGRVPPSVPDVRAHPLLRDLPAADLFGVGAFCSVPVHRADGSLYGTLCGLTTTPGTALTTGQLGSLRAVADLLGSRLEQQQGARDRRRERRRAFSPFLTGERRSLVLQPIVELATGTTAGYEALSRFSDAGGAPRRPDQVFAEGADLGLGVQLEQAAAAEALTWLPHLPEGRYLSVNLSARALAHPATFDLLTRALGPRGEAGSAGSRGRLVVELTERDEVEDYPALVHALRGLRARGLRLAVDDTGAGYASLQHLTRLAPEVIKLDITFVRGVHQDPARRAAARALILLAAELGATLVAEGVEDPAELRALVALGATHAQGYLLARPTPPTLFLAPRPARDDAQGDDEKPTTGAPAAPGAPVVPGAPREETSPPVR